MIAKIIELVKQYETDIILAVGVLLISLLSFAVGYMTAKEQFKEPIRIEQIQDYGTKGTAEHPIRRFRNGR